MANHAELKKPTDLYLHCLLRQDISGVNRTRVKYSLVRIRCLNVHVVESALGKLVQM